MNSFMIHIPIYLLVNNDDMLKLLLTFIIGFSSHAIIDDMKANEKLINLC